MEKIIKIDIQKESDLIEKYDIEKINIKLIEYIIKECKYINNIDNIKIIINNNCKTKMNIDELIVKGLKQEFEKIILAHDRNNLIQLLLLCLGIIFIFLSTLIDERIIWKEIILIIGWVPIWEMVDLELFQDFSGRRRKNIINKLLDSEIIIK